MSGIEVNELRALQGRGAGPGAEHKQLRKSVDAIKAVAVNLPDNTEDTAYGRASL